MTNLLAGRRGVKFYLWASELLSRIFDEIHDKITRHIYRSLAHNKIYPSVRSTSEVFYKVVHSPKGNSLAQRQFNSSKVGYSPKAVHSSKGSFTRPKAVHSPRLITRPR